MKTWTRIIGLVILATFFVLLPSITPGNGSAWAAQGLLPTTSEAYTACDPESSDWQEWETRFSDQEAMEKKLSTASKSDVEAILGCALKSGRLQFWMTPYFVIFALEFLIEIAGIFAILMIMVGAYYYMAGGLTDDKEKGKNILKYALLGFVLTLVSWTLVNILLLVLTR